MKNVEFCRDMASRCAVAAMRHQHEGNDDDATRLDGSALGFAFRADELEYDARGGMTVRQAAPLGLMANRPQR
jgi:hypothetical protein